MVVLSDSLLEKWQKIADLTAKIIDVPAALIMRTENEYMEVAVASDTEENPYKVGDSEKWFGLYCETVIKTHSELLVPNALIDKNWNKNPDIQLGMISYLGYPVSYPDKTPFGTICILDKKENHFSEEFKQLLIQYRDVIENDLVQIHDFNIRENELNTQILAQNTELIVNNEKLADREILLKGILDNLQDAFFRVDLAGKVRFANKAAVRIFAYKGTDEMIGLSMEQFYENKEDRTQLLNALQEHGFIENFVCKVRRGNNTSFWASVDAQLSNDSHGKLIGTEALVRDISKNIEHEIELEKIKENAKESESRLRSFFDQSLIGFAITSIDKDWIEVNDAICNYLGYTKEEIFKKTWLDLTHPEDVEKDLEIFNETLEGKREGYKIDKRFIAKNGDVVYCELSIRFKYNSDGKPEYVLALINNISQQEKQELLQHDLIELYKTSDTKTVDEVLDTTLNYAERISQSTMSYFHFVNSGADYIKLMNYSENTKKYCEVPVNGTNYPIREAGIWLDCFHQRKPIAHNYYKEEKHKKGLPKGHIELIRDLAIPVFEGDQIVAILGVGNKPTEYDGDDINMLQLLADVCWSIARRKNSEADLSDSNKNLSRALNISVISEQTAKMGSLYLDVKSEKIHFSDNLCKMYGIEQGDFDGTIESFNEFIHPEDHELYRIQFQQALSDKKDGKLEYRIITRQNEIKYVKLTFSFLFDAEGNLIEVIGASLDISEQKKVEQELISAKEKAEESDQLKTAFLNNISHEFRTPVNGILGFSELLIDGGMDEAQREEFVGYLKVSSARLLNIVTDTVEMSKLQCGNVEIKNETFDIKELLEEVVDSYIPEIKEKKLHCNLDVTSPEGELEITTDQHKISRIAMHLLGNAIKFTTAGVIDIKGLVLNNKLQITFSDTGIGIPKEMQEVIFEPFHQLENGLTRQHEGSGVGLTLVKAYIEIMKGELNLHTEENMGTTITVTIPINNN